MAEPSVDYKQLHDETMESGEIGHTEIKSHYLTDWLDRKKFVSEAFGFVEISNNQFIRTLPWNCPSWPGLYPKRWEIRPVGQSVNTNKKGPATYKKAKISLTFSEPEFTSYEQNPNNDSVVIYSVKVIGQNQYRTSPKRNLRFASDNKRVGQPVATVSEFTSYEFTLHRVVTYPGLVIKTMQGKCNPGLFIASDVIYAPAQTLRIDEWSTDDRETTFTVNGLYIPAWTIHLKLTENPNGWNKLERPDNGNWDTVTPSGGVTNVSSVSFDFLKTLIQ